MQKGMALIPESQNCPPQSAMRKLTIVPSTRDPNSRGRASDLTTPIGLARMLNNKEALGLVSPIMEECHIESQDRRPDPGFRS
jgi:hypothetical protein